MNKSELEQYILHDFIAEMDMDTLQSLVGMPLSAISWLTKLHEKPDNLRLFIIQNSPSLIQYIENLSQFEQSIIVDRNYKDYFEIQNPTMETTKYLLKNHPEMIRSLPDANDLPIEVLKDCVKNHIQTAQYVYRPSKEFEDYVYPLHSASIYYISNPSKDLQLRALKDKMYDKMVVPFLTKFIKEKGTICEVLHVIYNRVNEERKEMILNHPNYKSNATIVLEAIIK